jgi:glycosyltransferase involved in cell wall biosynthesis
MPTKQRVAIIGTNGLPAKYGGFETLANYLTQYLRDRFDFVVYCSKTPASKRLQRYNEAKLVYLPFRANGYQSVIYDIISIIHAWATVDKLLILGNSGALIFPFKIFFKKKIVLNIGGIDWGRSKWSYLVQKYIRLSEWLCVKYSDVVITDNPHIQRLYKESYGVDSVMIEYGGDHAVSFTVSEEDFRKYNFLKSDYILSVSRAQADNNIHILLSAFERMPEKTLVVISNWDTSEYGKTLKEKYVGKFKNIIMLDAIYDQQDLDKIRSNASAYIHSHSFCGTAPSLVEAMSLGLPVICFDTETNIETTENKSLYFKNEDDLKTILYNLNEEKRKALQNNMQEIAMRRYRWDIIANKYLDCLVG